MTIPDYKDSTIFSFFIMNPPGHSDKGLSPYAVELKYLILSRSNLFTWDVQDNRDEPDNAFIYGISAAIELAFSGFLLPCFSSNN